jgi:DNA-binding response OmpR family regulator
VVDLVEWGDVTVDLAGQWVLVDGRPVVLARKEFQVLALIVAGRGAVCTRERLVAQAWGRSWRGANRTLDVHVANVRAKLGRPEMISTVRGVGFRLAVA